MNSIDELKLSSQSPVHESAKSIRHRKDSKQTNEKSDFSKLFHSLSTESQKVNENQQQKETIKKLEQTLKALQELPKAVLSPEEQEILSAMMLQLLSLQTTEMKDKLQGENQIMTLFQQIEKELNELSTFSLIDFGDSLNFVGAEEKKFFSPYPNESEQEFKQVSALIQQLEIEQQPTERQQVSIQQMEQIEKLLQQLDSLIQELETTNEITEQNRNNANTLKIDPFFQSASSQGQQIPDGDGLQLEQVQSQDDNQTIIGAVAQDVKGSQVTQRLEASTQTPTVRMNDLIEDLSEILRGSFRLRANQEGTQLRVNISPEHLGHLDIRLTASEGKIAAQIFTSSLVAKEILDIQVNQLRNSLMQQGISIDRIEITHQNSAQSFEQQHAHAEQRFAQQQQRQGASTRNRSTYHVIEEEAAIERNHLLDGSLKVNYTI